MPAALGDGSTRSAGPLISAEMCHNSLARLGVTLERGSSPRSGGHAGTRSVSRDERHSHRAHEGVAAHFGQRGMRGELA